MKLKFHITLSHNYTKHFNIKQIPNKLNYLIIDNFGNLSSIEMNIWELMEENINKKINKSNNLEAHH